MAIDCQEAIARLSEPGGADDASVLAHLEGCPECRGIAMSFAALTSTAQSPSPLRLDHFASRVRAAHMRRHDAARRRSPLHTGLLAAACGAAGAAAVALLFGIGVPAPHHGGSEPAAAVSRIDDAASASSAENDLWSDGAVDVLAADFESAAAGEEINLALADEDFGEAI